jgi:hypothetical protein
MCVDVGGVVVVVCSESEHWLGSTFVAEMIPGAPETRSFVRQTSSSFHHFAQHDGLLA